MNDIIRRAILGHGVSKCIYCGHVHETICPDIKAIEWNSEGDPVRVELLTPSDRPTITASDGIHQPSAAFIDYPHDWRRDAERAKREHD